MEIEKMSLNEVQQLDSDEYVRLKKESYRMRLSKHTKMDLVDKLIFAYDTIRMLEEKINGY